VAWQQEKDINRRKERLVNISDLENSFEMGQQLMVGEVVLDMNTIDTLLLVYYSLYSPRLKEKFVRMLNNETERLIEFCFSQLI
jgi:hypothetical protein